MKKKLSNAKFWLMVLASLLLQDEFLASAELLPQTLRSRSILSPEAFSNATTTAAAATANSINNNGVITIPLTPHSVVRQRHLHEARRLEQLNRDAGYPARRRRRRRQQQQQQQNDQEEDYSQAQQVTAIFQGYGTHYADIWCGTPPQRQTVIVDTGSGVTAFPCSGCRDCGALVHHIDDLFDVDASSTFRRLGCDECFKGYCHQADKTCTLGQAYQEGSRWVAYEAHDLCYVGGLHNQAVTTPIGNDNNNNNNNNKNNNVNDPMIATLFAFDFKFGCQTDVRGLFKTQMADGIMGMDVAESSYWWQMYSAQKIQHKAFSLCFSRQNSVDKEGTPAGAMSFGGTDTRLHKTNMVYSATMDTSANTGFFAVHVKAVYLREPGSGGTAVTSKTELATIPIEVDDETLNGEGVIVDSGTTDTYFSRAFGEEFKKAWTLLMGKDYSHEPLDMTEEELMNTQPTIIFQLNGDVALNEKVQNKYGDGTVPGLARDMDAENPYDVILAIPPNHYYEWDTDTSKYISRFYVDDNSGGVFGANAMMGHDVLFDIERNRIGWAESDCDFTYMMAKENN